VSSSFRFGLELIGFGIRNGFGLDSAWILTGFRGVRNLFKLDLSSNRWGLDTLGTALAWIRLGIGIKVGLDLSSIWARFRFVLKGLGTCAHLLPGSAAVRFLQASWQSFVEALDLSTTLKRLGSNYQPTQNPGLPI